MLKQNSQTLMLWWLLKICIEGEYWVKTGIAPNLKFAEYLNPTGYLIRLDSQLCITSQPTLRFKWLQLGSNPEQLFCKWTVWPNGWVFVYKLSGSGLESSCSYNIGGNCS